MQNARGSWHKPIKSAMAGQDNHYARALFFGFLQSEYLKLKFIRHILQLFARMRADNFL